MHTFDVHITPEITRRAWNAFFFRKRRMVRLGIACLLIIAGMLIEASSGRFGPLSVSSATALALVAIIYTTAYVSGLRRAQASRAEIAEGKVSYTLTEETIGASTSHGSYAVAWSRLATVTRHGDLILLGFHPPGYSTLPVAQVPDEALAFLIARARAAGATMAPA